MTRRTLLLIAAAAMLCASAPAAAPAQSPWLPPLPPPQLMSQVGAPVPPASSFRSGFTVTASKEYEVGVMTFGSAVILVVSREGAALQLTETAYLARGVAAPERLQARFGRFGKVSMRFRESRWQPRRGKRRSCRGRGRFVVRRGVFVGNLRFRGEGGYVSVRVRRAKGAVTRVAAKCRRGADRRRVRAASSHFLDPSSGLLASARDGVDSTSFLAIERGGRTIYLVTDEEARGKLAIMRIALARQRGPLRFNEAVTAANVSPPPPFHGTGRYRAAPDGTQTWSGNLSVNFPGAPRFPLTGPGFETFVEVPF